MIKKYFLFLLATIVLRFGYTQTTTIDFETIGNGYTPSATNGNGNTDIFNRVNTGINGNTTFYWAAEDIGGNPNITLDQINISGSSSFTFAIDLTYADPSRWDANDELLITYSVDGGAFQNLMAVQNTTGTNNNEAALDLDFNGNGDIGQELSTTTFTTFTSPLINLNSNSTLDVILQFNGLNRNNEGIFLDNIVINQLGSTTCFISASGLNSTNCNDNSTSQDDSDDFITFELNPTGLNLGTTYSVSVSSGAITPNTGISYGNSTTFILQNGSPGAGDIIVTIEDDTDNTCSFDQLITDPRSCAICSELIISEYHEGTGGGTREHYIELYNPTENTIDLSNYRLAQYRNGETTPSRDLPLSGTIAPFTTYVIARDNATLCGTVDLCTGDNTMNFGGNDVIALQTSSGSNIDVVGVIGNDANFARNILLRRNANVQRPTSTYDVTEWTSSNSNDTSNLGIHTSDCESLICSATATWDGNNWNWSDSTPQNTVPNSSSNIIINGDYDTANNGGSFSGCTLTVNSGTLTINDGNFIEITNDVTVNDGRITTQPQGSFTQLGDGANAGVFTLGASGNADVNKDTANLANWFDYTYWSSPVQNATTDVALAMANPNFRFWFNAANYVDANSDNIDDDANAWTRVSGVFTMLPGQGFAATHNSPGFIAGRSYRFNFNGSYNTGDITYPIEYNTLNNNTLHWNLLGNPYPSALDIDLFFNENDPLVAKAIYMWSHVSFPSGSNPGNEVLNFSQNDYVTVNLVATAGNGSDGNGDGIIDDNDVPDRSIPSGQGFFIPSITSGNALFTNSMRLSGENSNSKFFRSVNVKSNNTVSKNYTSEKLWINLSSEIGIYSQICVAYTDISTDEFDGGSIDTSRNYAGNAGLLYSLIDSEKNVPFVIQGKAITSLTYEEIVKLGFGAYISTEENYVLDLIKHEGGFLDSNSVFLKDNYLNIIHDLKVSKYTFSSPGGTFNDRFEIVFKSNVLSVDDNSVEENGLSIVELTDGNIQFTIKNKGLTIDSVTIFDIQGRLIYELEGDSKSENYNLSNLNNSAYIAKVLLSNGQVITKKSIKK